MNKNNVKYHPLYSRWNWMHAACYKDWCPEYNNIGAKGIEVAWRKDQFREFAEWVEKKLGPVPFSGAKLARKDHNKDFAPGNLVWSTSKEVGQRCDKNYKLKYRGKTQTMTDLAEQAGINYHTFRDRILRGWTIKEAVTAQPWEIKHK
jgi:hypothetical protein